MIFRLLKIEIKKVFKRKSIYVIWILMLLFCFVNNFLYWRDYDDEGRYLYSEEENIEEEIKTLEEEEKGVPQNTDQVVLIKTKIELLKLKKSFSKDSWQYAKINDYLYDIVYEKNVHFEDSEVLARYQDLVLKFKNNDYLYFLKQEKDDVLQKITEKKEEILESTGDVLLEKELKVEEETLEVLNYRIKNHIKEDTGYLNQALVGYLQARKQLKEIPKNTYSEKLAYQELKKEKKVNAFILKSKVNYKQENTVNALLSGIMNDYEFFFVVIILMVSATLICDEYQSGTFKFLLIKPVSRFIILLSKYFTSLLVFLFSILLIFCFQFVLGGIFFGFDGLNLGVIVYDYGLDKVLNLNIFLYFFYSFLSKMPFYLMISLISVFLGVLTASTITSMIIPLMLSIFSSFMLDLAVSHKLYWMKYLPNFLWRFSDYLFGASSKLEGLGLLFSCIWYSIYFLILFFLVVRLFQKKDIRNM